jgi:hypothetical protein
MLIVLYFKATAVPLNPRLQYIAKPQHRLVRAQVLEILDGFGFFVLTHAASSVCGAFKPSVSRIFKFSS